MGFLRVIKGIFDGITKPIDVLNDWATEPLKRWGNNREQENKDKELQRDLRKQEFQADMEIKKQTEIERRNAETRQWEENQDAERKIRLQESQTELQIRMQTEIDRLNAETRQWEEDQDAARRIKLLDAFKKYQMELMDMNTNAVRAIGEMSLDLKNKAQNLVLEKTKEYKALQDNATNQALEEVCMIEEKYANNERVKEMLLKAVETKLVGVIENCTSFINELSKDITEMNKSINMLTSKGQDHIQKVLENTLIVQPKTLKLGDDCVVEDAKLLE